MKIRFLVLVVFGLAFIQTGCGILKSVTKVESTAGVQALPPYSGPKARIAVADFEVITAKASGKVGSGLREMLINSLVDSNRFSVVELAAQEVVKKTQEPANSEGAEKEAKKPEKSKMRKADLVVNVKVAEFDPKASGGRAGVGGGGGVGSGVLGGLSDDALNKAYLSLDIRVADVSTSEILGENRVEGQASDISGAIMTGFLQSYGLGNGLSAYANTPMEKAIRICIIEAVKYIAGSIPASYYKY